MKTTATKTTKPNTTTPNRNTPEASKRDIPTAGTITLKKLPFRIAKKVMDEEVGNTPRQWSMHPYCGGYIQALLGVGCIDDKTADKLWNIYAQGV